MKKILLVSAVLMFAATSMFANDLVNADLMSKRTESKSFSGEPAVGKMKLGIVAGSDEAVTVGIRTSDTFEFNAMVGYSVGDGFLIGANALFTLVDLNIAGQILPLSLGPAVNLNIGTYSTWVNYRWTTATAVNLEALALLRWEYSFEKYPLNLFIEFGAGVSFGTSGIGFGYQSNLGARYIF